MSANAAERGDLRYQHRALIVAACIDARSEKPADLAGLSSLIEGFLPVAGPDGWRDLGDLAAATGSTEIWHQAETLAAALVKQADGREDSTTVAAAVRRQLDAFKP